MITLGYKYRLIPFYWSIRLHLSFKDPLASNNIMGRGGWNKLPNSPLYEGTVFIMHSLVLILVFCGLWIASRFWWMQCHSWKWEGSFGFKEPVCAWVTILWDFISVGYREKLAGEWLRVESQRARSSRNEIPCVVDWSAVGVCWIRCNCRSWVVGGWGWWLSKIICTPICVYIRIRRCCSSSWHWQLNNNRHCIRIG